MSLDLVHWCRRKYRGRYRRLRVLPTPDGDHALWLDDGRVRAVVATTPPLDGFSSLSLAVVPDGDVASWYLRGAKSWEALDEGEALGLLEAADTDPDEALQRLLVRSINKDHAVQLEGSLVSGAIDRLDQVFPRAELYLFELLQNAVDERAHRVSFRLEGETLVFEHDGDPFNASDILGLSAIGASGKSGRTIGFMGLGFKAVYSRFRSVALSGGGWRVAFAAPPDSDDGSWKFLPNWAENVPPPSDGYRCRFEFGLPLGGVEAVREDLGTLPDVVPVLLARRALVTEGDTWKLDWNGRAVLVERDIDGPGGAERFSLRDGGTTRTWMFLGTRWQPSEDAVQAWRKFRKDPDGEPGEQELCLFAELDESENLVDEDGPGRIHAVLPTAQALPMGFHLQANWLLQMDRQGAMSGRDQPWNADIVRQIPALIIQLLEWIAHGDGPPSIEGPYGRLPIPVVQEGSPRLRILDVDVDASALVDALLKQPLVPVLTAGASEEEGGEAVAEGAADRLAARRSFARCGPATYRFAAADSCRSLPEALLSDLSPSFLRRWLGGLYPFAFSEGEEPGNFFRSLGVIREPSESIWRSAGKELEAALLDLPTERARAWATVHVTAAILRSHGADDAPPEGIATVLNACGQAQAIEDLDVPPRQYLFLDDRAREILAGEPESAPALAFLQLLVAPPTGVKADDVKTRMIADEVWPKGGDERRLRDVTEPFFVRVATDAAGWKGNRERLLQQVVTVTRAIQRLSAGHDAVTHVLTKRDGEDVLLPKRQVWVGAAYGFPQIEAAGGGTLPVVSSAYGEEPEWRTFFTSACRTRPEFEWGVAGKFSANSRSLRETYPDVTPNYGRYYVDLDLPFDLGSGSREEVFALCTNLPPWVEILEKGPFDAPRASSFASFLGQGRYTTTTVGGRAFSPLTVYLSWVADRYTRGYAATTSRVPKWVAALRDNAWVPTDTGAVVAPKDVLLVPDPHNVGAPVAALDEPTRAGLLPLAEALKFGSAVPRPGPLSVLVRAAERPATTDDELVTLWRDVLGDEKLDRALLRERAAAVELIPISSSRRDGRRRVTSDRLVKVANADFGGFLCALAHTRLAEHAEKLADLLAVPDRPSSTQALAYLDWVWSVAPPDVEEAVVAAWKLLAGDSRIWGAVESRRNSGAMKLFCRQPGARKGEWLPLPGSAAREPVWNDDQRKSVCLRASDGLWPESWLSRRGVEIASDAVLRLTGIEPLSSDRFDFDVVHSGDNEMPDETRRLGLILRAVRAAYKGDHLPRANLELRRANSIERTFRVGDGDARVEALEAVWDGDHTLRVVGSRSAAWATDLRPLVQQALGLGATASELRFLDLLPLIDDDEHFARKLDQICVELDVPADWRDPAGLDDADDADQDFEDQDADDEDADDEDADDEDADDEDADDGDETADDEDAEDEDAEDTHDEDDPEPSGVGGDTGTGTGGTGASGTGTGGGGGGGRGGASQKPKPRGGPWDPGVAPNRFLMDDGTGDQADATAEREKRLPKDDAAARDAVMKYERRHGRVPTEADRYQRGYDVASQDGAAERKIEIKGLQGGWQGQASVSMTGAQFDDARSQDGDWWLYVVEYAGSEKANVIPLRNPALGARSFYLYACHWRKKAISPPPRRLKNPDDDESKD